MNFEKWVLELWYFTCIEYSVRRGLPVGTNNFILVTLTLEFYLLFENFYLANNFWTVSARALTFHMNFHKICLFEIKLLTLTFDQFFLI